MELGTKHEAALNTAEVEAAPARVFPARRLLERHPVFADVPAACITEIAAAGAARSYGAGQFLTREGDPAQFYWLLLKGSVRAFCSSKTGQAVTVQLFAAPAAWAETPLLHDQPHAESCVAVDGALVLQVPKHDFQRIIRKYPALMMNVLTDASGRLLIASERERAMAFGDVSQRLADLLMSYVRIYGVPVEGGCMIRISLSQNDLASDLGIALKSVSRAFKHFVADGLLEKRGTNFVVRDVAALRRLAPQAGVDWVSGRKLA